ncbi:MAG: hypothetical protein H8E20_10505 [Verrucomicrobia bacterium]|nr:hypothetical protein [Verrucomicrobiota bacterium]
MACRIFIRERRFGNGDFAGAEQMNLTRLGFSVIEGSPWLAKRHAE